MHLLKTSLFGISLAFTAIPFAYSQDISEIQSSIQQIVTSNELETSIQDFKRTNKATIDAIDDVKIKETQTRLPKFSDIGEKIRFGTHNTVTTSGEQVINLLRTAVQEPQNVKKILADINAYAKAGSPEAQNAIGFLLYNGYLGVNRNSEKALEYFKLAAAKNYQPALYNLAIDAVYSHAGTDGFMIGSSFISRAYKIAPDNSSRVCGFAAFISYRLRDHNQAQSYSRQCTSPLASLVNGVYQSDLPPTKRIELLRTSIATGLNDGFQVLEYVTSKLDDDRSYLYCKYHVVNQTILNPSTTLNQAASDCYEKSIRRHLAVNDSQKLQIINGITSFAYIEKDELLKMRQSNKFRFSMTVPYLPFNQIDVDLFSPIMTQRTGL